MACSPEALVRLSEKAKHEIGESTVDLEKAVEKLKQLVLEKYGDLRLPPNAEVLLERGLRYRKFELERAATHLNAFFKFLRDMHDMHGDMYFLPTLHQKNYFESFAAMLLKNRDSRGRSVLIFNFDRVPPHVFSLDHALTVFILFMDEITRLSVETQRIGFVVVSNLKGYGFSHARQFTLSRIRAIARIVQGAFPARFKGFHVVNAPKLFTYSFALIKPFIGEKMKKRVTFHGEDFTDFHKQLSPDILPECLGGKLGYEEACDLEFTRRLSGQDGYYRDLFRYGYMKE